MTSLGGSILGHAVPVENVKEIMDAYMTGEQDLKWIGSKLEHWSSTEELLHDPQKRKEVLLRVIEQHGVHKKAKLIGEMMRRGLIW